MLHCIFIRFSIRPEKKASMHVHICMMNRWFILISCIAPLVAKTDVVRLAVLRWCEECVLGLNVNFSFKTVN